MQLLKDHCEMESAIKKGIIQKNARSNDSEDDAIIGNKIEKRVNKMEARIKTIQEMFNKDSEETRLDNQQ